MKTILVPHTPEQTRATLWVAADGTGSAPAGLSVFRTPGDVEVPLPQAGWRSVTAAGAIESRLYVQTVTLDQLQPGTTYFVKANGARARFSTLPARLPREGGRPFSVLLTSCFSRGADPAGLVGNAVATMEEALKPNVKILCGDQVYLDYPSFFLGLPLSEAGLADNFLAKYRRNWGDQPGYRNLLEIGATYFTADDHEFWNNYPNPTTLVSNTWTSDGRRALKDVALSLYRDFQCDDPQRAGRPRRFQAGRLAFFIADTRLFRAEGDVSFMSRPDFDELQQWLRDLGGPAVLVVGQPLFRNPSGWFSKRFGDRALSNYEQYKELIRALFQVRHSVLILTGDVHFGRIASCRLWGAPGPELVEIIASPSSLVNPLVGGNAEDAPPKFPPQPLAGVAQTPARTLYKTQEDHFVTLHFTETSGVVRVEPRYWFPRRTGSARSEAPGPLELF